MINIKHKFTSAKADGSDTSIVRPSNWNDTHNIELAGFSLIGKATAGQGLAQEITLDPSLSFSGTTLAVSAAFANSKADASSVYTIAQIDTFFAAKQDKLYTTRDVLISRDMASGYSNLSLYAHGDPGQYSTRILRNAGVNGELSIAQWGSGRINITGAALQFNGATIWHTDNLNPAVAGNVVQYLSGVVEFGAVNPQSGIVIDLPAPYVVTGLRTEGGSENIYLRGRTLRQV